MNNSINKENYKLKLLFASR